MATYGFGAHWSGDDMTNVFLKDGVAAVGYDEKDAPVFHALLKRISNGDVVYLKSFPPDQGLIIKAVGIVSDDTVHDVGGGRGVDVRWVWNGEKKVGRIDDKFDPGRMVTVYEELNPDVQKVVLDLLFSRIR